MKKIVFVNDFDKFQKIFSRSSQQNIDLVRIDYDDASKKILDFLKQADFQISHIDGRYYISHYEKIFANFIGQLNIKQASFPWWLCDLTNKNPITTRLFYTVYYALLIEKLILQDRFDCLLVLTDDKILYQQAKILCRKRRYDIINGIKGFSFKKILQRVFPGSLLYKLSVALYRKCLSIIYLPKYSSSKQSVVFIMSLLYHPCFVNNFYRDVYFGDFIEYLKEKKVTFINFMEICAPTGEMIKSTRRFCGGNVYPKEFFLSFGGILKSFLRALKYFIQKPRTQERVFLKGVDVSFSVNQYMLIEYTTTRAMSNLLMFEAVKEVSEKFSINRFYYPFENRSFEKMIIMALRKASPQTRIIGYQHASFSLRHINFLLAEGEETILPLPDKISTLGSESKRFLIDVGGFPKDLFQVGCALRQKGVKGELKRRRSRCLRILVALATDIEEYVKVLYFLNKAFKNHDEFEVWIRPHPTVSLEAALKVFGKGSFKYYKADKESLFESYQWADVLVYVHSMVSVEGLMYGVPAIRLDLDYPVNPDSLIGFDEFKWEVSTAEELMQSIHEIQNLSDNAFKQKQQKGQDFAKNYMRKVTEQRLDELYAI